MELDHLWGVLFGSLHAMVPITLAAIGETIEESAGLFNIGLEGILLISALSGALGAEASGSALIGLTVGMGTGALIGLVFGVVNTYWKGSQLITGVGINLFAFGFVAFMLIVLGAPGFHSVPRTVQIQLIPLGVGSLSPLVIVTGYCVGHNSDCVSGQSEKILRLPTLPVFGSTHYVWVPR